MGDMRPAPGFHHLHLNSVDPDAAIDLYDHIALSVTDLDAWVAKLRAEGVRFLEEPYRLGDTRAVMIEGPSRLALELVEIS
jgi:hypothetical protein